MQCGKYELWRNHVHDTYLNNNKISVNVTGTECNGQQCHDDTFHGPQKLIFVLEDWKIQEYLRIIHASVEIRIMYTVRRVTPISDSI
jgi:hypothetical protein